jgi:phosphoribosylamine-glycine ligase
MLELKKKMIKYMQQAGRVLNFISLSDDFLQARDKVHQCIKKTRLERWIL